MVLSPEEVSRLLASTTNIKHKAALSLAYATGLRSSEVVSLKLTDIDSHRMVIRIEQGKSLPSRKRGARRIATSFSHPTCSRYCVNGGASRARRDGCIPASPGCSPATGDSTSVGASSTGSFAWQPSAPALPSVSVFTRCGTALPPIFWSKRPISASSRCCSKQRHTARQHPIEGRIYYPFHPRCGESVLILRQYAYRDAELVVIPQPDGSVACIPAWMTHESAAHHQLDAEPRLSLDILRSLRAEIDALELGVGRQFGQSHLGRRPEHRRGVEKQDSAEAGLDLQRSRVTLRAVACRQRQLSRRRRIAHHLGEQCLNHGIGPRLNLLAQPTPQAGISTWRSGRSSGPCSIRPTRSVPGTARTAHRITRSGTIGSSRR